MKTPLDLRYDLVRILDRCPPGDRRSVIHRLADYCFILQDGQVPIVTPDGVVKFEPVAVKKAAGKIVRPLFRGKKAVG